MKTEVLDLRKGKEGPSISRAAELLKDGKVVAIPTETVYGLAASAYDDEAIKNIFIAKGRPQDNPLIVHISDLDMLKMVANNVPNLAYTLAEKFWPGPFTMVLEKNDDIAKSVTGGLSTVAVRLPANEIAREVISKAGLPLAAPSANISGKPSPVSAEHVIADLSGKIDAVLCSADSSVGVESTVLSLCSNPPRLLRPGAVTAEQLLEIIPDLVVDKAVLEGLSENDTAASPGMKYKHYSPEIEVVLVDGDSKKYAEFVNNADNAVAVCFSEDSGINVKKYVYGSKFDEATQAKNIFGILRQLNNEKGKTAYVHAPSKTGIGLAVYNRLIRAAAFKVINL